MGNFWHCTGLLLRALIAPDPRGDGTDDRLSTGLDVDVLDGDALLPLAAMAIQGFAQSRESPGESIRLVQVLAPTFEGLLRNHRTPVALHDSVMGGDRLSDQHSLEHVTRLHAAHRNEHRLYLLFLLLIGAGVPAPWTEAQKRAYVLADNQLAITGSGWDPELLRLQLGELKLSGFDLSLTGFGDLANTSPDSRGRAHAREAAGNQRPWPADKVERWAIDRLIPYAKNARTHTEAQGRRDRREDQGVGLEG